LAAGSLRCQTTIESQRLASEIGRFVGKEPCNGIGNFLWSPDAAKGVSRAHPVDFFTPKNREQHLSAHGTGTHCIDPNTASSIFDRSGFR
jgi:hypothetical protein